MQALGGGPLPAYRSLIEFKSVLENLLGSARGQSIQSAFPRDVIEADSWPIFCNFTLKCPCCGHEVSFKGASSGLSKVAMKVTF